MPKFFYTKYASKKYKKLDANTKERIRKKIASLKNDDDYRSIIKVHDIPAATHRLRVGQYRLAMREEKLNEFVIVDVDHRSKIYQ